MAFEIDKKKIKIYVEDGCGCPYCGSCHIDRRREAQVHPLKKTVFGTCHSCGLGWVDVFVLTTIEVVTDPTYK